MSKKTKIWLMAGVALVILGALLFAASMMAYNWDFTKLSTQNRETNTYEISENFSNISINTDTADVEFVLSGDGNCRVICDETEKEKHSVTVKDGTLVIDIIDEREWKDYIGINFDTSKITLYLPQKEYEAVSVKISTGDIYMDDLYASDINVSVSTGDVDITDAECKNLVSEGSTGEVYMEDVIAEEKLSIQRSTGDIKIISCDADELFIKTSTGDVTGSLKSDKVFITKVNTGDVDVPDTTAGGRCEIATSTGDIKITIE